MPVRRAKCQCRHVYDQCLLVECDRWVICVIYAMHPLYVRPPYKTSPLGFWLGSCTKGVHDEGWRAPSLSQGQHLLNSLHPCITEESLREQLLYSSCFDWRYLPPGALSASGMYFAHQNFFSWFLPDSFEIETKIHQFSVMQKLNQCSLPLEFFFPLEPFIPNTQIFKATYDIHSHSAHWQC